MLKTSGARTSLKVGGGGTGLAQTVETVFLWSCPSTFSALKSTISRFGERLRNGQYSLVSFLFAVLLTVPPVPSHL